MAEEGSAGSLLPGTKKNKPIDIKGFLSRYAVFILVAGNFGFTLLAPFAFLAIKPFYKASARLRIDPVVQTLIGKGEESSILMQYRDFAKTQAIRMRDISILKEAVERLTPEQKNANFPKGLPAEFCAFNLEKILYIKPISRSYLIDIALQGKSPAGLAEILNNIMDVYKEHIDSEKKSQNDNRLKYLSSERDALKEKIRKKAEKLQELAQLTSTSSFSEAFNFSYKKTEQLQHAFVELYLQRVDAENLYFQRLKEKEEISAITMQAQVEEMVANDWGLDSTQSWTYQKLQEMRSTLDGLSEDNADRKYTEERMKAMRKYEKDMTDEVRELARIVIYGKREYELKNRLITAKNKFEAIKIAQKDIQTKLNKAKDESALNSERLIIGEQLQAELRHMRELLFKYESRINELVVQSNAASRISISVRAKKPDFQAGSNAKNLFMLCLALPFGAITFILFIIEFMDNRIRSPLNVVHALGYPSTWPIAKAPKEVQFSRVTLDAPNSVSSKAVRSLALRLNRDAENNQSKVFLFSGVEPQTGTTEILLNTAHQLGQMVPQVLLIESTSDNPTLRKLLGVASSHPGLSEILDGRNTFEECVYTDNERNINVLFASDIGDKQKASLIFKMILAQAKKDYDIILMDSTQILNSSFTEYLSMNADVVILVIQGDRTMYRTVRRVAEFFIRLEVPAIAAVLNWGGPKYVTRLEKFMEKPFLKFFLERLRDAKE